MKCTPSNCILILSVAVTSATLGASLNSFFFHYPDARGWLHGADWFLNRYQITIAGLGGVAGAGISIRKLTDQIPLQREQAISNKRFALRKEIAALTEFDSFFDSIAEHLEPDGDVSEYHLSKLGEYLEEDANSILQHHSEGLPSRVTQHLSHVASYLERFNRYGGMTDEEQDFNGPCDELVSKIQDYLTNLYTSVREWRSEINSFLK